MTIKTLRYIHDLLVETEKRTKEEFCNAKKLLREMENREEPDEELIERQREASEAFRNVWKDAEVALIEFEEKEW